MATSIKRFFTSGGKGSYEEIVIVSDNTTIEVMRDTVEDEYLVQVYDKIENRDFVSHNMLLAFAICDMADGLEVVQDVSEPLISNMSTEKAREYVGA